MVRPVPAVVRNASGSKVSGESILPVLFLAAVAFVLLLYFASPPTDIHSPARRQFDAMRLACSLLDSPLLESRLHFCALLCGHKHPVNIVELNCKARPGSRCLPYRR